ncbi:MAG: hypothetical protein M1608_01995 [Candidatus Omnitrophica bacterium]|nr:hypothetical protein [Candidatus Omnitrophota bacterium]
MTLIEGLVATAVASLAMVAIASIAIFSGQSFAALGNYADLELQSRHALDLMSQEIRQANDLRSYTSTSLTFDDYDGQTLTYQYDPEAKTLIRIKGDEREVLLRECNYLVFSVYQRNTIKGSFDQYAASSAATGKLVQLSWVCSRTILGTRMNTESVQSAKIVIRK